MEGYLLLYRLFIVGGSRLLALTAWLYGLPGSNQSCNPDREMSNAWVSTPVCRHGTYGCGLAGIAGAVISSLKSVAPQWGKLFGGCGWRRIS